MRELIGFTMDKLLEAKERNPIPISWYGLAIGSDLVERLTDPRREVPTLPDGRIFRAKGGVIDVLVVDEKGRQCTDEIGVYTRLKKSTGLGEQSIEVVLFSN